MALDKNARVLLYLLLLTDAGFICLHIIYTAGLFPYALLASGDPTEPGPLYAMLGIDYDRGFAELFGYLQETWTILLLGWLMIKRSWTLYAGWALLFVYFLLDDALSIHEHIGRLLANGLSLPAVFGLRAQDLGELLSNALFAAVIFPLIAIGYWLGGSAGRNATHRLMKTVVLLVVCGVGFDMLDEALPGKLIWTLLEDGGEMVAMSLALYVALSLCFAMEQSPVTEPTGKPQAGNVGMAPDWSISNRLSR